LDRSELVVCVGGKPLRRRILLASSLLPGAMEKRRVICY